jgi:ATP-dependent DNA helicase DinG
MGLLVVCDPRMGRMGYGKALLKALPAMTRLETEVQALAWLEEVATVTRPA